MDNFIIRGGRPLSGQTVISGSKNAALPILAATLLTREKCEIKNVPELMDIKSRFELLNYLGKNCFYGYGNFVVEEHAQLKLHAPYDLVRKMRASVLAAGPLLARFRKARFSLPGGCSIGMRPIDIHLEGFKKLGARVSYEKGDVVLSAKKLKAGKVKFRFPSVGATENLMMCAALIDGTTTLEGCAREPEIEDLASALAKMGAKVEGAGTPVIKITGAAKLKGLRHTVMPDRVETGTFMLLCAAAGGRIRLLNTAPKTLEALVRAMKKAGVKINLFKDSMEIIAPHGRPKPVSVATRPHPGFPTDLQAPWMVFMARADGICEVHEQIFENRFMHAPELVRMGADITVTDRKAVIRGVPALLGAPVMASDIRAGAALVVAAAAAKGKSIIRRIYHIDRGYEKLEHKLKDLGVDVSRVKA
jgi:UDP-N-acetylglucosamine 1-carboxyvinyltransferase